MKKIIIVVLTLSLAWVTYLVYTTDLNTGRILHSTHGCCTIYWEDIDVTDTDVKVYHVRYTTTNGEVQDSYVEQPELESEVNMYQEYCYAHHN